MIKKNKNKKKIVHKKTKIFRLIGNFRIVLTIHLDSWQKNRIYTFFTFTRTRECAKVNFLKDNEKKINKYSIDLFIFAKLCNDLITTMYISIFCNQP